MRRLKLLLCSSAPVSTVRSPPHVLCRARARSPPHTRTFPTAHSHVPHRTIARSPPTAVVRTDRLSNWR
jgi:hypothetical protein